MTPVFEAQSSSRDQLLCIHVSEATLLIDVLSGVVTVGDVEGEVVVATGSATVGGRRTSGPTMRPRVGDERRRRQRERHTRVPG